MTSRFFDPGRTLSMSESKQKVKADRTMYYAFPEYVRSIHGNAKPPGVINVATVHEEALVYFGKQDEFHGIVREKYTSRRIKELFNGNLVKEWTGLKYWASVKKLMDEIRLRLGDNWKECLMGMNLEQVRSLTIDVKDSFEEEGLV
jgi:hypothetical protein